MKQKSVVVLNEKGNIHQWRGITGSAIIILIRHGKSDIVLQVTVTADKEERLQGYDELTSDLRIV